jgi:hypothetical protein
MRFLLIFVTIFLLSTTASSQTISPYTKYVPPAKYESIQRDLSLELQLLCVQALNENISRADKFCNSCKNNNCDSNVVVFEDSSWLLFVISLHKDGYGYSVLHTKDNSRYYFNYIAHNTLMAWDNADSAGNFYHRYIKERYSLSTCMDYTP